MRIRHLLSTLVLGLAACETIPATLDPAVFAQMSSDIAEDPRIAIRDQMLTALLARADLTEDQRADVLIVRADHRLDGKFNLLGALEDYDAFIGLRAEDPRADRVTRQKVFATSEIESAQRRLARLQNLPDWFDDQILMGDVVKAASRYRSAKLTPTAAQLSLLRDTGFVCEDANTDEATEAAEDNRIHHHGDAPEYLKGAVWCADPSLS